MAATHDTDSGRPPAPFGTDVLTLDGCWDFFVGDGDLAGMADHEPAAITVPEREYLEHLKAESARWAGTGRPCWSPSSATGGCPTCRRGRRRRSGTRGTSSPGI